MKGLEYVKQGTITERISRKIVFHLPMVGYSTGAVLTLQEGGPYCRKCITHALDWHYSSTDRTIPFLLSSKKMHN